MGKWGQRTPARAQQTFSDRVNLTTYDELMKLMVVRKVLVRAMEHLSSVLNDAYDDLAGTTWLQRDSGDCPLEVGAN